MLRRSRISVRPNVRPAGRGPTPGLSQDPHQPSQEALPTNPQDVIDPSQSEGKEVKDPATTAGTEKTSEPSTSGKDEKDQSGQASSSGTPSAAGPQRRKRYSVMPNLAKPRVAPALTRSSPRTPRSPVRAASETLGLNSSPGPEAPGPSSQAEATVPHGLRSPRRRRPSGGARQPRTPPAPHPLAPMSSDPTAAPPEDQADQETGPPPSPHADATAPEVSTLCRASSQAKEDAPTLHENVQPSLPSREASELSERAQTLVSKSVKSGLSLAPGKSRLSRLLNDPTDLQRLAKARKLRELLRQEMNRERKMKKTCIRECIVDPAKMTMRDLIYYLPDSNPMTSFVEDKRREAEIVVPPSPSRDESPEGAQEPEVQPEPVSQREEEEQEEAEEEEEEEDEAAAGADAGDAGQLMVPRVKVAADGSLIIDEESLTVEVQRAKGPNLAEERDPIFERGSTTTYSSFRKGTYTKPWSNQETDMFFLAISMVGTDFSMIGQLFPHRVRIEIKNKFKREERENSWRIDKAFKERRKLDIELFTKLLEKILSTEEKKKPKSPTERKVKHKRRTKARKSAKKLSDVEEEEDEEDVDDINLEGEKENEGVSNEEATAAAPPKKKRKVKNGESSPEKPKNGKKKKSKQMSEQDEASVPGDAEAALPEDQPPVQRSEDTGEPVPAGKSPVIKPAQLSRGRAQRPVPVVGRRWGQRGQAPCTKPREGSILAEEESSEEGMPKEQVDKDASSPSQGPDKKQADVTSSDEEEESRVTPAKPTRYGRLPKPIQHLNYPAKESRSAPDSDAAPGTASPVAPSSSSKPKPPARRAKPRSGPSLPKKLVTLWASQSEESEEEEGEEERRRGEEAQAEEDLHHSTVPGDENQAPAFVPMGLRSPLPVTSEVEETMEELNISVNVPDVLGISQDALCLDASCEQAQGELGAVPCEHQLDLLVDVIEFLSESPEYMEVSQESYNEAARTLLTIGNQTLLSQATQDYISEDHVAEDHVAEDHVAEVHMAEAHVAEDHVADAHVADAHVPEVHVADAHVPEVHVADAHVPEVHVAEAHVVITEEPPNQCHQLEMSPQPTEQSQSSTAPPETVTSDPCTVASQRPVEETADFVPVQQSSDATPTEMWSTNKKVGDIGPPAQAESGSGTSEQTASQTRRTRLPKLRPKPNLGRASRTAQSKPQPSKETSTQSQPAESTTAATTSSEPQPTEETAAFLEPQPIQRIDTTDSKAPQSTENSEEDPSPVSSGATSTPASFSASTPAPALESLRSSETATPHPVVTEPSSITKACDPITAADSAHPTIEIPITNVTPTEVASANQEKGAEVGPSTWAETGSESSEQTASQTRRTRFSRVKPKPNLGRASRTAQSKPQPAVETLTSTSKCIPVEDIITHSEPKPTKDIASVPEASPCRGTLPESQPRENPQQSGSMNSAPVPTLLPDFHGSPQEVKGHMECLPEEGGRGGSDRDAQRPSVAAGDSQSEPSDSGQASNVGQGSRRARLSKPNLSRGDRVARSQSVKSTSQPDPGPSAKKPTLGDLAAQILIASEAPSRKSPRPLGGARTHRQTTAQTQPETSAEDHSPPTACPVQTTLDTKATPAASPPHEEESQPSSIVTPNSEAVSVEHAVLDPEEPFFILSLTEIPIYSTGEQATYIHQPLSNCQTPAPGCSQPHSSDMTVPGGGLAVGVEGGLCNAPVPMELEEGAEGGVPSNGEAGPGSVAGSAHTSGDPVPEQNEQQEEEAENPRKRSKKSRRAAELQPTTHPSSAQPRTVTSGEKATEEPQKGTIGEPDLPNIGGAETEDSTPRMESQAAHGITPLATNSPLSRPGRRPKGFLSFMADKGSLGTTGVAKAASQKPQPNTSRRGRKLGVPVLPSSTETITTPPEVEASETPDVRPSRTHPEPAVTKQAEPCTSLSTTAAEVVVSQQSEEEEPINNVSQYFFSDIFTEVEESGEVSNNVQFTPLPPRPKGFLSFMADKGSLGTTGVAKAPSQKPQPNTSRRGRKRGAPVLASSTETITTPPEVEASETPDVRPSRTHPEPAVTKQAEPCTSLSTTAAEVAVSQQSEEEEPSNVSQYVFSDIFTEVEESGEVSNNVQFTPWLQPGRRPKGFLSFMADKGSLGTTGVAKAASQKPQPNTSRRGRKRGAPVLPSSTETITTPPEVEASETPDVRPSRTHPEPAVTKQAEPCTSLSTTAAEVAVSQQSEEEEPINSVSQYFFSDIFTEVEESEG